MDEEILVRAILLAQILDAEGVLDVGDEMPLAIELEEVVLRAQPLSNWVVFNMRQSYSLCLMVNTI